MKCAPATVSDRAAGFVFRRLAFGSLLFLASRKISVLSARLNHRDLSLSLGVDARFLKGRRSDTLYVYSVTAIEEWGTEFYRHIAEYWDELKIWADDNMVVARIIHFSGVTATLYVRPTAKVLGLSGGWFTSHGSSIEAKTSAPERFR